MDSDAHFIAAMHAGLVMQKQRHSCVPDDEDELAKGGVWGKLRHCPFPTGTSDSGRSIDNAYISNVDHIVPTTYIMPYNDIDTYRSREPRMRKKFLFLGISAYMDHKEHVVASMKRRKSFLIKESAARAIGAGCQLVKNADRYPYVLNSMQQVFISAQYLPFPRNSLPT
ncbi:hypothetical protein ALC60_03615 [Trachymyrmex zeteki]|uniref:Uncharacterized protein n=1 Tax=Mycetomoellerius zeteki TaxID=64791 RepID=A0A151XB98_9HYME|nr:hypothetical protein ALC60_03615 [Trachymyrmex zeteki]